jgi:hypothetical protein
MVLKTTADGCATDQEAEKLGTVDDKTPDVRGGDDLVLSIPRPASRRQDRTG